MTMEDYWDDVYSSVFDAKGIAFDTCHKIYVLMDDAQVQLMREYEYDPLYTKDEMSDSEMFETLKHWYAESCGLKFISAVSTNYEDPNEGFESLIPQFAEQEEECEDCYERGCKGVCMDYDDEDEDEE